MCSTKSQPTAPQSTLYNSRKNQLVILDFCVQFSKIGTKYTYNLFWDFLQGNNVFVPKTLRDARFQLQLLAGLIHERFHHFITKPLQTEVRTWQPSCPSVPGSFHSLDGSRVPFDPLMTDLISPPCIFCLRCCLIPPFASSQTLQLYFVVSERPLALLAAFGAALLCLIHTRSRLTVSRISIDRR